MAHHWVLGLLLVMIPQTNKKQAPRSLTEFICRCNIYVSQRIWLNGDCQPFIAIYIAFLCSTSEASYICNVIRARLILNFPRDIILPNFSLYTNFVSACLRSPSSPLHLHFAKDSLLSLPGCKSSSPASHKTCSHLLPQHSSYCP